jgi:hypothetical protein
MLRSAPSLNRESSDFFSSARSSYVGETNVVAKAIDSSINWTPCIALAKPVEINRTFDFHPFLETTPSTNSHTLVILAPQVTLLIKFQPSTS